MMLTIITFFVILFVILIMSIGVITKGAKLKGSCGGVTQALGDDASACSVCEREEKCRK